MMKAFEKAKAAKTMERESWLYTVTNSRNTSPRLPQQARATHGSVLFQQDIPPIYLEDIARHNALDEICSQGLTDFTIEHDHRNVEVDQLLDVTDVGVIVDFDFGQMGLTK